MDFKYEQLQKRHHTQSMELRIRWVTAFQRSMTYIIPLGGCKRFSYELTSTSCLSKLTSTYPSTRQYLMQKQTNTKHKMANDIVKRNSLFKLYCRANEVHTSSVKAAQKSVLNDTSSMPGICLFEYVILCNCDIAVLNLEANYFFKI